ncbi:MAG: thiamine pyrophosphate-binding protein [Anaerolineae bacterium]
MTRHGGDVLVEMLLGYGVPVVFGLAGGQTLPLYDAIRSRTPRIRHVPMRDERNAAYAADGYARVSGRVGVCDATVGPGSIKLTSGLAEAFNSSVPLVALVSDMPSDWLAVRYRGGGNQLVDQMAVLAPLCKWTGRLPNERRIPELVQRAFQMATSGRPGPVAIELPEDLFKATCDVETPVVDPRFGAAPAYRPAPDPDSVREAVELLEEAARPVVIAGGGVWLSGAGPQLVGLAERLALPVATTLSGKGVIPETHPLALGVLGALGGTMLAREFVQAADVIFAVGFKFGQNPTFKWTLPKPTQRIIHLDIDGAEIGKMFPVEVGMVADARVGLAAMLAACSTTRPIEPVAEQIAALNAEWRVHLEAQAVEAQPIKPQQVAALLNALAGPDDVLVCDASFASGWGGMYFEARDNRRTIFPRGMAGLGWGLPAAIGAQIARPGSKVIVLAGDGAMTFCLGELATLAQEGLNVKVVVLNNSTMAWIKWEQAMFWEGRFQSTDLSDVDFAMVARGLGCLGIRVSEPDELRDALTQALVTEGPAVVDVRTAASEAAMPKFTESQSARARMQLD